MPAKNHQKNQQKSEWGRLIYKEFQQRGLKIHYSINYLFKLSQSDLLLIDPWEVLYRTLSYLTNENPGLGDKINA